MAQETQKTVLERLETLEQIEPAKRPSELHAIKEQAIASCAECDTRMALTDTVRQILGIERFEGSRRLVDAAKREAFGALADEIINKSIQRFNIQKLR